ncbi:hypothetical protein ZIOFF_024073 [Zingiber officinale]|uniref:Uncharacterized protein n=1 Tax=Zingiber officinale TaxID=94328 RepID=A0A8J5LFV9_ZINOF|nr:hypothetical protein ZIOFF_024073 [Zingiber officinale]
MVHIASDSTPEITVIGALFEYGGIVDPFLDMVALNELKNMTSVDVGAISSPVLASFLCGRQRPAGLCAGRRWQLSAASGH